MQHWGENISWGFLSEEVCLVSLYSSEKLVGYLVKCWFTVWYTLPEKKGGCGGVGGKKESSKLLFCSNVQENIGTTLSILRLKSQNLFSTYLNNSFLSSSSLVQFTALSGWAALNAAQLASQKCLSPYI